MRLLNKGLTESVYRRVIKEGSFGDEVGFSYYASIDDMEDEFTSKLYSFFGMEPSSISFIKFELHRGTSWTDDNPWMLVELEGIDDIVEKVIQEGKDKYPKCYETMQTDDLVIYSSGLELGRNHGNRDYYDVVCYTTLDRHYLTYQERSEEQNKSIDKQISEEEAKISAYIASVVKEHYKELLGIMLDNEGTEDEEEMYESKKVRKSKKLEESFDNLTLEDLEGMVKNNSDAQVALDDLEQKALSDEVVDLINSKHFNTKDEVIGFLGASDEVEKLRNEELDESQSLRDKYENDEDYVWAEKTSNFKDEEDFRNYLDQFFMKDIDIPFNIFDYDWVILDTDEKKVEPFIEESKKVRKSKKLGEASEVEIRAYSDEKIPEDQTIVYYPDEYGAPGKTVTFAELKEIFADILRKNEYGWVGVDTSKWSKARIDREATCLAREEWFGYWENLKNSYSPYMDESKKVRKSKKLVEATDEDMEKLKKELRSRVEDLCGDGEIPKLDKRDINAIADRIRKSGFFISNDIFTKDSNRYEWEQINMFLDNEIRKYVKDCGLENEPKKKLKERYFPGAEEQYFCRDCGHAFDEDELSGVDDDGNDLCPACGSKNIVDTGKVEVDVEPGNQVGLWVNGKVYWEGNRDDVDETLIMDVADQASEEDGKTYDYDEVDIRPLDESATPEEVEKVKEMVRNPELGSVGSIEEINGKKYYVSDSTFNGYCYKDMDAYYNRPDDVCYICEGGFDDGEDGKLSVDFVNSKKEELINWGSISTRNSIFDDVRTKLDYEEFDFTYDDGRVIKSKDFDDKLIEILADEAIDMVDWQSVNAYVMEQEDSWLSIIDDYYNNKLGNMNESEETGFTVSPRLPVKLNSLVKFVSDPYNRELFNSDGIDEDLISYIKNIQRKIFSYSSKEDFIKDVNEVIEFVKECKNYFYDAIDLEILDYLKDLISIVSGNMNESAKPKKKKESKEKKDEKRVVMQQGNVTCFKENDNKFLVFENENDNEVEYKDQDSAMKDFMNRVGVDPNGGLTESKK